MTKKTTVHTPKNEKTEKAAPPDPASESEALEAALAADKDAKAGGEPVDSPDSPPETKAEPQPTPKADPHVGPAGAGTVKQKKATPAEPSSSFNETMVAKREARDAAIAKAESELDPPREPTEAELENLDRQDEIQDELAKVASDIEEATKYIEQMKIRTRDLMAEAYPHTITSDRLVTAVRGYLESSQAERANRGAHPARLKELLKRAGLAPIDASMARNRARGTKRQQRTVAAPSAGGKE